MKSLFRNYLFNLLALYLATSFIKGFTYTGGYKTLFTAALVFTLINFFIKPIINLFMLPLNFLSLGLLSWVVNVLMLYLLIYFLPEIRISSWYFPGISGYGFVIPSFNFTILYTYVLVSFFISLITNFLSWLCHK